MVKRGMDLVLGMTLVVLTLPVVLVALVVSAATLRRWPFFVQTRIGRNGVPFRIVKVRTLPATTPAYLDKHSLRSIAIPRPCELLRQLHLDELPQLALVITGRMSLVGPRPEMPHLTDAMEPTHVVARTSVRPGCTGLWQVSESCTGLIAAGATYDSLYLQHRSFRLDCWVLWRTVLLVATGKTVGPFDLPAWIAPKQQVAAFAD